MGSNLSNFSRSRSADEYQARLWIHHNTKRGVLVTADSQADSRDGTWLPLEKITVSMEAGYENGDRGWAQITMPGWLARDRGWL